MIIYFNGTVDYSGRASSTLTTGNYLVIYKPDKSISIHGSQLIKPLNYLGPKSILTKEENKLTFTNKKEQIIITINKIINNLEMTNWSNNKPIVTKTEKELVHKLINDFTWIGKQIISHEMEHHTEWGPIDILAIDVNDEYHAIEVKRKKATVKDATQLLRYCMSLKERHKAVIGWLAAPEFQQNAIKFLNQNGLKHHQVNF